MVGGDVPYQSYVEAKLQIPGIKKFNTDVLMLVLPNSSYGMSVSVQMGSIQIDMALQLITPVDLNALYKSWQ